MTTRWNKLNVVLGETVKLKPVVCLDKSGRTQREAISGKIVYINHKHNYFTAEFPCEHGSFRESFKFYKKGDLACALR